MSKIILIALIISSISCQNFLANPQPEDIGHLVEGFLGGLQLFAGLPHENQCIQPDDAIIADVEKIIDLVQHLDKDNLIDTFSKIAQSAINVYNNVKVALPVCQAWKDEVVGQFTKIGQYVSDKEYLTKLATHLVFGLEHIKNDITDGTNAYNNGEFSKAGKSFGDAVHFTFFWDFK
jgi:hypothetical protein